MIINAKTALGYLLFIVSLAILFTLGLWQLNRGLEKASIAKQTSEGSNSAPLSVDQRIAWQDVTYRRAALSGTWRYEKTLLLENRLHQGQPGYEVLVPFELAEDQQWMLVNRGWIHKQSIEAGEVNADLLSQAVEVPPVGQLYLPQKGFTLGQSVVRPLTQPLRFLYYDFSALSEVIEHDLMPAVLVLEAGHEASFKQIWKAGTISAERHYAYTAQWWGLAITLLIFGLVWRRRAPV